jgi:hypothetical protein
VIDCQQCHTDAATYRFAATPTSCVNCHESDYRAAREPDHTSGRFSTECIQCHLVTAFDWRGNFDHETTAFPLTGSHRAASCVSCHQNQVFGSLRTDCVACHQVDYASTTNPNHSAANFPTICQTCHTTNAWVPSTFDHDQQFFRIYSGKHRNKWILCADCHQSGSTLSEFTCTSCHEHRQSAMDSKHAQVGGYVYASPACYSCHRGA